MTKPTVICLTPVKNEVWILERFLRCVSLWADYIIIADQGSDDGSIDIATSFPKVILVDNPSPTFNEPERQKLLLETARSVSDHRLLIALDADEFITANVLTSPEWNSVLQVPIGTVIRFQWPIILSDLCTYWMYPYDFALGFMDDGSDHEGKLIHSPRIPVPLHSYTLTLRDIKVMHYIGTDTRRWRSKIRWYQCWEMLNKPQYSLSKLYRSYHRDFSVPPHEIKTIPKQWFDGYKRQGIDMTSISREGIYRWDKEILQLFSEHGTAKFKRLSIWDVNWSKLYEELNPDKPHMGFHDPRTWFDRIVHKWLRRTQPYFSHYAPPASRLQKLYFHLVQKILQICGW